MLVNECVDLKRCKGKRFLQNEFVILRNLSVFVSEVFLEWNNLPYFKVAAIRANFFVCMLSYKVCSEFLWRKTGLTDWA